MTNRLPKISLSALPSPPPPGNIQLFDGYFPALTAGTYRIDLSHAVEGPDLRPFYELTQDFIVQAPQFFIDTTVVQSFYPPAGGSDIYGQQLAFLVLTDPGLPWERSLVPGEGQPDPSNPVSWLALLIFADGEIYLPPNSNNPVSTTTVRDLLAPNPDVLKPQLSTTGDVLSSQCQTITIPGAVFNAVMPLQTELRYLVHCRAVNTLDEGEQLLSVFLSNRLAVANSTVVPAAPLRYYAHLVSLEGFAAFLGPDATPIPHKPDSNDLMDVQIVSLLNWTFVSQPQTDLGFTELVQGLIESEHSESSVQSQQGALSLPIDPSANIPAPVLQRLEEGYVALEFVSGSGDDTFAWYRGPFTATQPQALPPVGNPSVPVLQAGAADELMIYLAEQGLFDLSYAAAWNIGRELALADAGFTEKVSAYKQAAIQALTLLTQRLATPLLAGEIDPHKLLAVDAGRRRFARLMGEGLGRQWTAALDGARRGHTPPASTVHRSLRFRKRSVLHPRDVLAQPGVSDAISESLGEVIASVAGWLANLSLLRPVPFSNLVPDPRMLPVESIRFFYVDQNWIDALLAGALSIAMQNSSGAAVHNVLLPFIQQAVARKRRELFHRVRPDALPSGVGNGVSGMLIRSQLVSGWPRLAVMPTLGGAPLNLIRDELLSPNVRLCIFDGIPDAVTLAEPYVGTIFGTEDGRIFPRCVTNPDFAGVQIPNIESVTPLLRTPPSGNVGGVLEIIETVNVLETAVGILPFTQDSKVIWNGEDQPTVWISANELHVSIPDTLIALPGTVEVMVSNGEVSSQPATFTIQKSFEIDSINPTVMLAGSADFVLTVFGVGFTDAAVIQWNGSTLAGTMIVSATEATVTVPNTLVSAVGEAQISIRSGEDETNVVILKIVSGEPVIDLLAPAAAMAGDTGFILTLSGSGFALGATVQWNDVSLITTFVNEQQLSAFVPADLIANSGTVSITVVIGSTPSNAVTFTIADKQPAIGSMSPSVAMAGGGQFQLTIEGVNFSNALINWNDQTLTPAFQDSKQLIASVPPEFLIDAGIVTVSVSSSGMTSNQVNFAVIEPQPTIGLLDPSSIVAGATEFTLRVIGGFGAGDFALQMITAPESQSFPTT